MAAKKAFRLAVTWVMSYDFQFPKESTAGKLSAHTRGTVFANAQNKHSAPGICTLSGNSMLKLYRFTGEEIYLEWMRRISHAIPQFVSLNDRPVDTLSGKPLLTGYINERIQTSDWEGKHTVGEFLYGSNWPEVSMLYDARVTVLAERGGNAKKLGHLYYARMEKILVPAGGECVTVVTAVE